MFLQGPIQSFQGVWLEIFGVVYRCVENFRENWGYVALVLLEAPNFKKIQVGQK